MPKCPKCGAEDKEKLKTFKGDTPNGDTDVWLLTCTTCEVAWYDPCWDAWQGLIDYGILVVAREGEVAD
jgi:hypothetical protein